MPLSAYMITGEGDDDDVVRQVAKALDLGVPRIQLRRKGAPARALEALARRLRALPGAAGKILVNDRLDVALGAGLAGVHLPADGLPLEDVLRSRPPGFLVACSTHTREEARRASELGASFVVFGPVFPTRSKAGHPGVGIDALKDVVSLVRIPVFALGGVTPERVTLVRDAGAAGVAGISCFADGKTLEALLRSLEDAGASAR
jgi:thiamine-phosphate pyrophosphorylase